MKGSYIIIFFIILSSGCVTDINDSVNYHDGYEIGYSQHNITDYNICNEYYYHSWGNQTFDRDAFDFAYGYKKGYELYSREYEIKEYEREVNEIRSR